MAQQFSSFEVVRIYGRPLNRVFPTLAEAKSWAQTEGLLAYHIYGKHVGVYGATKLVDVPWTPAIETVARQRPVGSASHPLTGRACQN